MQSVELFDLYVQTGLQVIALYPETKIPIGNNWNGPWNAKRNRELFAQVPNANMGVLLGNIVDVEGDTVEANEYLAELIGETAHPNYLSSRSHHHLFLSPDPQLTRVVFDGIEFRGHRHQSAIPPSVHRDGNPYLWLGKTKFPVPPMPEKLLHIYEQQLRKAQPKHRLKPGHTKRSCSGCGEFEYLHKARLRLEITAFRELGLSWFCHDCRTVDVRDACRRIKTRSATLSTGARIFRASN